MTTVHAEPEIIEQARIPTWFGVGGRADRMCKPQSARDAVWCVRSFETVRVLGDGANLLVADGGVGGLVVDLRGLDTSEINEQTGVVRAEAGLKLPKLINETARAGLGGLEVLAGIPASVGGAAFMNAGGKFGEIADSVTAIDAIDPTGEPVRYERAEIEFSYRRSGIPGVIIAVEFSLTPGDPIEIRDRLKSCMAYKKSTQPLAADSAGCCFKNPVLTEEIDGIGPAGARTSAGQLLDRAGCKGMRVGGASVSEGHANFLITDAGATASDVLELMTRAASRVRDEFGVVLEREVVVWDRDEAVHGAST